MSCCVVSVRRIVVGMLLYLAGNTRPDIAFVVRQCARFLRRPMKSHEDAVKRIVRYLIGMKDKGCSLRHARILCWKHMQTRILRDFGMWRIHRIQPV